MTTLLATVRGVPQTYYGTEICIKGSKDKGDADLRKDFPGGWPDDSRSSFKSMEEQTQKTNISILQNNFLIGENQSQ